MSHSANQSPQPSGPSDPTARYTVGTLTYTKMGLVFLVRSVATIAGGFVGGLFMDLMKHLYNGSDYAYRFIPLWSIFWSAIALFFLWRLYQDWKKLPVHD